MSLRSGFLMGNSLIVERFAHRIPLTADSRQESADRISLTADSRQESADRTLLTADSRQKCADRILLPADSRFILESFHFPL